MPGPVCPAYKIVPYVHGYLVVWERKTDREPRVFLLFRTPDLGWPGNGAI